MEVQTRILKVLNTITKKEVGAGKDVGPAPEDSLFVSGLLDSFALTDFVAGLEEEFGISIPDSDLSARKFDTLNKVTAYVSARLG
jgi:acyl carrier protein